MNRVVKSDDLNGPLPDPRTDANWQARLEEARAKRAIALAERAKTAGPKKKRLKPWEEEGAVIVDGGADEDVAPESGLGFSDRVEAMRDHARDKVSSSKSEAGAESGDSPKRNWAETAAAEPRVPPAPAATRPETPVSERKPAVALSPAGTVNDLFNAPEFAPDAPADEEPDSPLSMLLRPEPIKPSPVPAWRQAALEEAEPVPAPAAPAVQKAATPKRSAKVSVGAVLLIAAVAVGPIWQMTRPVERGPLVFTLSAFALEPALGLHSPMFETPRPTRPGEWSPVADIAPRAPYDVGKPFVPAKVPRPADFAADPALGPPPCSCLNIYHSLPVSEYLPPPCLCLTFYPSLFFEHTTISFFNN